MKAAEILARVDHTLLKQTATWAEIQRICEEAKTYHTATVMVPSCFIARIKETYGESVKAATVVGFPNGNCNTAAKIAETAQALADGAEEIDMVINVGALKAGETKYVTDEIKALKQLCGERVLKVIVETCFLTEEEKIAACKCVTEGGADFIKTSTGFGTAGATLEDIKLFKEHIGEGVQMKAAGGIHTREEMEAFIEAGCTRLGASAAVKVLKDEI
ncbi:deoxyribose-phosphate aldolase [Selenomonas sp. KH1T6]|uniref:deoxyribose-phosphate aldolase n=1 Tax=Selenomonas sp. KH1T6 TaxID=3158784 RepID=UPI0008A72E69|nr:deoxyribose-phosphate aldolase [Selenomonas ruminantium]